MSAIDGGERYAKLREFSEEAHACSYNLHRGELQKQRSLDGKKQARVPETDKRLCDSFAWSGKHCRKYFIRQDRVHFSTPTEFRLVQLCSDGRPKRIWLLQETCTEEKRHVWLVP